jgi:predicted ribonuclease YlaK
MATLAISRDVLTGFAKLPKPAQNKVSQLAAKFRALTAQELRASKGIHLERYEGQADPSARTIRIDDNFRGVVIDAGDDEHYILTLVDTHDRVDRWMVHNRFRVNEATGALEVHDPIAIRAAIEENDVAVPSPELTKLYGHRRDKEFAQVGVNEALLPALRAFSDEEQLQGILGVLPQGQAEALILLTGNDSVETIYAQVAGAISPASIDPTDLAAAINTPASQAQFHVVADDGELQAMLAQPLAQWRTYLHPSQRDIAYRPQYNGPVRVTGGAGTGKTVVAIHRAVHLARQLADDERVGKPILFTTFTKNLAQSIEREIRGLGGSDALEVIDVVHIDSLANRVVRGFESGQIRVVGDRDNEILRLWQDAVDELALPFSPEFLRSEFEQVVLAQRCGSRNDYFSATRSGRGVRLNRRERAIVWAAIEYVLKELSASSLRTFLQVADDAAGYLLGRAVKPYRYGLVDEAQDLHESHWRLVRAAVNEGPNDLFIVGDAHQRIYDRRTSLAKVGINIVGRSKRLRINYRTTHEILRWSLMLLGEETVDDLADGRESQTLAEYHSFLHGPAPTMVRTGSRQEQLKALAAQMKQWLDAGLYESDIAVAARTSDCLDAAARSLRNAGIATTQLGGAAPTGDGVRLGTMHRLKGVEFRAVALIDMDDETMPLAFAVTDETADPVQHDADLRRERCTAYVASTRARDDLWVGWSGRPSRFILPMIPNN